MLLLTVVWISEMIVAPVGIYLVFTLYFVYLQVFDSLQGGVSVVFATAAAITLHISLVRGVNTHHILEASFKAAARAIRDAVRVEGTGVPSTKGVL